MTPEVESDLDAIDAALRGGTVPPELTELGALALALREERPAPDPFFTRDLDARAAAGFPKGSRPSRVGRWLAARPLAIPGAAASVMVALVVAIAAIGGSMDAGYDSEGTAGSAGSGGGAVVAQSEGTGDEDVAGGGAGGTDDGITDAMRQDAIEEEAAELDAGSPAPATTRKRPRRSSGPTSVTAASGAASGSAGTIGSDQIAPPPSPGSGSPRSDNRSARKVERSASMVLAAPSDEVARVADGIIRVTDGLGGFVVSSSVSQTEGGGSGTFELRIPSAKLQQGLAQLSRLANVRERQEAQQDITASFVSARERLADARAEREGLLRALARADTLDESRAIRARLRSVSSRISAAKSDLARVQNRASYSTVVVTLVGDDSASGGSGTDDGQWTPGDAARDALRVLEVTAGVLLVALAVALPLLVLGVLAVLAGRMVTRRRRERALDAVV